MDSLYYVIVCLIISLAIFLTVRALEPGSGGLGGRLHTHASKHDHSHMHMSSYSYLHVHVHVHACA